MARASTLRSRDLDTPLDGYTTPLGGLLDRVTSDHHKGPPGEPGTRRRKKLRRPPARVLKSRINEASPPLTSTHTPSGANSVSVSRITRPSGYLQSVSQGNIMPTLAFEECSSGEPYLVRIPEDDPLATLLAQQYHAFR